MGTSSAELCRVGTSSSGRNIAKFTLNSGGGDSKLVFHKMLLLAGNLFLFQLCPSTYSSLKGLLVYPATLSLKTEKEKID